MVGLIRVSIGPAISVMLRGCAALSSSAMSATAASTGTQGWQTPTTCEPGPRLLEEADHVVDIFVEAERPSPSGTSRTLCQSVM